MELKNYFAQDDAGNILPGAECSVFFPDTTERVTTLENANGGPRSNPFFADSRGLIQFAAPNGRYDLQVKSGALSYTIRVQCADLDEAAAAAEASADAAAVSASEAASAVSDFAADLANPTDQAKGAALIGRSVIRVTSIAQMQEYGVPAGWVFELSAGGRSGTFDVMAGDYSAEVAADTLNGIYVPLADDPGATTKVAKRRFSGSIHPKWFGALVSQADASSELQACFSFASEYNLVVDGELHSYSISDKDGIIPASAGSFREDRGLYVSKCLFLRNIEITMLAGVDRYTTTLNAYTGPDHILYLENVRLFGNGTLQSPATPPTREDGGIHGLRLYGNDRGDGVYEFGNLILKNVYVDDFYSDGILVRPIVFKGMHWDGVESYRAGRNGVTYNSRTFASLSNIKCNFNGVRAAPKSGFHYEPDSSDVGLYEGIQIDNIECKDNVLNGLKLNLPSASVVLDKVRVSGFNLTGNSEADLGFVAFTGSTANHLNFSDGFAGIIAMTATDTGALAMYKEAFFDGVTVGTSFRCQSSRSVAPSLLSLRLDSVNTNNNGARPIEVTGSTFPNTLIIDVDTLDTTGSSDFAFRIDSTALATSATVAETAHLRIGKIVGPQKATRIRGYERVYAVGTDFNDCLLDCRIAAMKIISVKDCYFNSREDFEYFIRAENALSAVVTGNLFRNVTDASANAGGALLRLGAGVKYTEGNMQEDAAGVITAYV